MESAASVEDPSGGAVVDEKYEFSAPRWFDFVNGETEEESRGAELWFDSALCYGPSPSVPRIKARRSFKVESMCNFNEEAEKMDKAKPDATNISSGSKPPFSETKEVSGKAIEVHTLTTNEMSHNTADGEERRTENSADVREDESKLKDVVTEQTENKENIPPVDTEACTPKVPLLACKGRKVMDSKNRETARKIASMLRNPSALKSKKQSQLSQAKGINQTSVKREANVKNITGTHNLAQENQAIKRQKLEGGRSRQILNPRPTALPHKTKQGLVNSSTNLCPSAVKQTQKENRKVYIREQITPFVSTAELMKKFQSSTRDLSLPHTKNLLSQDGATFLAQNQPRLTLTRPKEPEFETSQRVRPIRVKSSAEIEEEIMSKIPKFKARPVNKKILAAPTLSAPQKSTPHPPEFQEFHLETMARANQHVETSSIASTEVSRQHNDWRPHLTEPKSPALQTMLRARPTTVKSSTELEQEELEKAPKFKARPLNKKIFESKGEMGIFCNTKKHITIPQEFHFATDERISRANSVVDLFDKLSLNSEPCHENHLPRNTAPNPFHLRTEERGAEKEKKFVTEIIQKQIEEERARVPKANPYPYNRMIMGLLTVLHISNQMPPKPEPRHCTKPEPFQLESLVRHEEEMQREMEERMRMEREEARKRVFKAQPVLKEDPIPVPGKVRKPLTEIQEFNLHVEHRAGERAEFDQKVREKEKMYKRYREESDAAQKVEEEKALKQLRRTLVPQARPVPNFSNPFLPQKSNKEITKPKSPKLRVIKRTERRKMMMTCPATTAAAAHMR
ncbi:PREDICTED: protein TPX2 [Tarenaya hassleriana]|uniref:protein TPX2 n=1 Tax=Tarenaya hassleriana TaxID=28532 RepID=UPI00053C64CE|nr:PREDICTED: protein TPX2 [Tarenaya hassleriana]